jgi:hypothetical protein
VCQWHAVQVQPAARWSCRHVSPYLRLVCVSQVLMWFCDCSAATACMSCRTGCSCGLSECSSETYTCCNRPHPSRRTPGQQLPPAAEECTPRYASLRRPALALMRSGDRIEDRNEWTQRACRDDVLMSMLLLLLIFVARKCCFHPSVLHHAFINRSHLEAGTSGSKLPLYMIYTFI